MSAFSILDTSFGPGATPAIDDWTTNAAVDAYPRRESGGVLSVLGDLAIGAGHAFENPVKLAEEALLGVGTAAVVGALAPGVAMAVTAGAGIYGAYELTTHVGDWLHAAGVVANASDHSDAELAAAHQSIQGVGEGAIDLAAAGVGGLRTMAFGAARASAVDAALADAPAAAIAPTDAAIANASGLAPVPADAAIANAPGLAPAPADAAIAEAPAVVTRPIDNVTATDTAACTGTLMPQDVSVMPGDITQAGTDAIITGVNSVRIWAGGVDTAIQSRSGGWQFYKQLAQQPDLIDGQAVVTRGNPEGPIKNVVFAVDDHQRLLKNLITNALMAADKAGFKSVSIPAMRVGTKLGTMETPQETAEQMVRGVQQFINQVPQSINKINFVISNDPTLNSALQQEISKLSLPLQWT